jgi:integrase
MGRKKTNKSLIQQVKERLDAKLAIGESKYAAKREGTYTNYIFSWETYRSYLKHDCYFVKWCKEQPIDPVLGHKPRTLEECRPFAERWVQSTMDRGLSAYTVKLEVAALAKLYGCKSGDFDIETPARRRANIKRSRGDAARDKHFSVSKNSELITFCKCTGLRRAELAQIRGTDLIEQEGKLCLDIKRGTKGGRLRISPVVGSVEEIETVKWLCAQAGEGKVFPEPSENADIHSFRAAYATKIYNQHKRDYSEYKNERLIIFSAFFFCSASFSAVPSAVFSAPSV